MEKYDAVADEQLISEFREGNSDIMDYLMVKYKSMVRKKARAMYLIGGENEDLIQEGMIGLIKAVRDYSPSQGASFASFAELCVSRQMYTAIEASKRKKHMPLNSYISLYEAREGADEEKKIPLIDTIEPAVENNPETLYFGKEFTEVFVEELKENLSALENHVLYLHLLGTDYRTIAELLGKSPKAIDNALQRSRSKAEKLLTEEAPALLKKGMPLFVDSLYLHLNKTNVRLPGENMINARYHYLFRLTLAECMENKRRYIPAIEKALVALCNQLSLIHI